MTYIENVFLCMVSPLLIAALCMGKRQIRFFFFCFAGMGACLLSDSKRGGPFFFYLLSRVWNGGHTRDLRRDRGRRACVCLAADMAENRRDLRPFGGGDHLSCDI